MQEIGGDGLLIDDPLTHKAITEVTDGLAPAVQQRGLRNLITHARRFARIPIPMKSIYAAAVMNPNPNLHNHLGYAESFIKAAESLGYKLCCSTNRLRQVGHQTHQVYGAIHNFSSKPLPRPLATNG